MNVSESRQNRETEIDLLQIFRILKKKIWIIIAAVLICSGIAYEYTLLFVVPSYQAGVMIYVNNSSISVGGASISISDAQLSAAYKLVDTYIVILKARSTLEEVISLSKVNYSYEQLYSMIEGYSVDSTEIFKISVTSRSPSEAALLANTIAQVLPQRISEIVEGSSVKIVDYAVTPLWRVSPSYTKNISMGAVAGFVLSVAYIIIRNQSDTRITSKEYLTQVYGIPVIGIIPDIKDTGTNDIFNYYYRSDENSSTASNP
ncbi:MAG TPA: Wzz/FepE/Etk N-terminal domain-containing protein [Oscillospiraceae bacterium]|nr:Wzz/FepE/Etk N-terminal domain-containing protein [Oscillospiraceae bacterium]HPF54924.1 Wzz/FepE/Etk N-terminal domain-containing protein [Clostridiales bacterium]HPK34983.1 Wzz/FepE/Etk N-terminal domain-containing protein [Oscillospiraceae bacterium]HPR75541.1 Wzz/FepE/Etk N-terminal domain-containing protein [Oscillospiraceae bacterium]